jgi:hypothetical protein
MAENKREEFNNMRSLLIQAKGTKCCNCEKECGNDIIFHHIVPLASGGTNNLTNIAPICETCDGLVHDINRTNWKELQRQGIEKAKAEGKYKGRKQREINWEAFGLLYDKNKAGLITKIEMGAAIGCSRPTLLNYIKQYKEIKKNEMQNA